MQYAGAQAVWCQEEPKNMGAWRYIKPRMDTAMRELMERGEGSAAPRRIRYVGRPAAASPGLQPPTPPPPPQPPPPFPLLF